MGKIFWKEKYKGVGVFPGILAVFLSHPINKNHVGENILAGKVYLGNIPIIFGEYPHNLWGISPGIFGEFS